MPRPVPVPVPYPTRNPRGLPAPAPLTSLGLIDPGVGPLAVFVAPETTPSHTGGRILQVDHIADDKYKLTFVEGPDRVVGTTAAGDLVWAFGKVNAGTPASDEWRITEVSQRGQKAYLIETPDKTDGKGWVASSEDNSQIAVRVLIMFPTYPPSYPTTQLFNFDPAPPEESASAQA